MWLIWLMMLSGIGDECPDVAVEARTAYDASLRGDRVMRDRALDRADRGLGCSLATTDDRARARFYLALAQRFLEGGDENATRTALLSSWRAWSDLPTEGLSQRLVSLRSEVIREYRTSVPATFWVQPPLTGEQLLYVDGRPTLPEPFIGVDIGARYVTTAGLHMVQVVRSPAERVVLRGGSVNLFADRDPDHRAPNVVPLHDLADEPASLTPIKLPEPTGPTGGCAGRR